VASNSNCPGAPLDESCGTSVVEFVEDLGYVLTPGAKVCVGCGHVLCPECVSLSLKRTLEGIVWCASCEHHKDDGDTSHE